MERIRAGANTNLATNGRRPLRHRARCRRNAVEALPPTFHQPRPVPRPLQGRRWTRRNHQVRLREETPQRNGSAGPPFEGVASLRRQGTRPRQTPRFRSARTRSRQPHLQRRPDLRRHRLQRRRRALQILSRQRQLSRICSTTTKSSAANRFRRRRQTRRLLTVRRSCAPDHERTRRRTRQDVRGRNTHAPTHRPRRIRSGTWLHRSAAPTSARV